MAMLVKRHDSTINHWIFAFATIVLTLILVYFFIVRHTQSSSSSSSSSESLASSSLKHDRSNFKSEEVAVFTTRFGSITFRFFEKEAPLTVANFKNLVKIGAYERGTFYRAEPDFVLQGGADPHREWGVEPIKLEYHVPNYKKTVSMARRDDPDSATSDFSIQLNDNSKWLGPGGANADGYAVFAEVIDGWNVVEKIMQQPTKNKGMILLRIPIIFSVRLQTRQF